jgi:hypothetical protein
MFDPFDAFDPIDPGPSPDPPRRVEAGEPSGPTQRSTRRWVNATNRRVQPTPAISRPAPEHPAPSRSDAAAQPAQIDDTGPSHDGGAKRHTDLDSIRSSALSDFRAAVERLLAHGHVAALTDEMDTAQLIVTVYFTPSPGPLVHSSLRASDPARFELRVTASPGGDAQAVVGYATGPGGAPFTFMGRRYVDQMDRTWVARRFNEFVQRVLEQV